MSSRTQSAARRSINESQDTDAAGVAETGQLTEWVILQGNQDG